MLLKGVPVQVDFNYVVYTASIVEKVNWVTLTLPCIHGKHVNSVWFYPSAYLCIVWYVWFKGIPLLMYMAWFLKCICGSIKEM